ncbi:hypothetical protein FN846DRAFT_909638 [Sphaerosporella brunnea]|uniref:Uncharacterized protein n=1 Tax=Sphaerosporella brunnea TaxID=1250544 RepID=A0A5J5EQ82_9PEZI|nr:hypothetical protein FN846DRAFT_909638 [Sphaerosporella brunnea]
MLISLTVGKLDAGLAILLTEDKRLIEFPSILLPPGITSGSIVDIQVSRNTPAETAAKESFAALQDEIYNLYGVSSPKKPVLRLRNATQTSIVLEWDPIELATATLRSLTLYRNGAKAGAIPNPTAHTSTKISGLAVGEEYTFHLVLRTSAGTYSSEKVTARTHKMTDLSGITVCPGVMPAETREALEAALQRIGARPLQDSVRIDTTHFICTEGRGAQWEKALDMNIPVVRPEWIFACENEGRIVVSRNFYLGVDVAKMRHSMPPRTGPPPQTPVSPKAAPLSPRPQSMAPMRIAEPQGSGSESDTGLSTKPESRESVSEEAKDSATLSSEKLEASSGDSTTEVDGASDGASEAKEETKEEDNTEKEKDSGEFADVQL